jgi:ABC-type glycerol-3-phosphate transport system substrate-binding protein
MLAGSVFLTTGRQTVLAACSGGAGGHYYASVDSGTGPGTTGTGATTTTWTHWSVTNNGVNFSDVAVWLINPSNVQNSIETGFYSGGGQHRPLDQRDAALLHGQQWKL